MSSKETQRSSSDQGSSIVSSTKVCIPHQEEMRSHTNEVQRIERCTTGCSQETQVYVLHTVEG